MVLFTCRDLGIDCSFETTGATDTEILKKFIDHAEVAHNMPVLTAEVIFRVRKAIKNRGYKGSKPTIILPESWGIPPLLLLGGVVQEGSDLLRSHCMKKREETPPEVQYAEIK